jgi:hypothetical protein
MKQIDAVKLGLLFITIICVVLGIGGLIWGPADKKVEIALGALNGASLIGGWLGHAVLSGKDDGSDMPQNQTDKDQKEIDKK